MNSSPEEIFRRLLDESSAVLGTPEQAGVAIPDDDLHREILVPLLPAMLGDGAIRKHWHDQAATGFLARLTRHLQGGEAAPRWQPGDFEIHVTASYSAGPDARALADTLLSEESLREMSAALMNQILVPVWSRLPLATPVPAEPVIEVAVSAPEVPAVFPLPTAVAPVPAEPVLEVAVSAPEEIAPFVLPAAVAPVPRRIFFPCQNPIRGTRTSHGGLGAPDWSASYPLAGWRGCVPYSARSRERSARSVK